MGVIIGVARLHPDKGTKKRGDYMQTKLPSYDGWSERERKAYQLVELSTDDPDPEVAALVAASEARLLAQAAAGEPVPIDVEPFAEYEVLDKGTDTERADMKTLSTIQLDLSSLTAGKRTEVLDYTKEVACIKKADRANKRDKTDRRTG